jgi:hypothetical protein
MCKILAFPRHKQYNCPKPCEDVHCEFCEGGLFMCVTCRGAEGSLPRDCPGAPMSEVTQDAIYLGGLDYRGGEWVVKDELGDWVIAG